MDPTSAREAAPSSAKRRRDQQLRAQRRHVGWLVSLLQTGGHHSFKGGVAPRQAMDTATKNDEDADAVEMVRSLKAHVAMLESRLEGLTALLCGVIGKAVEPGAGTVASAGGEPSSAEDKRTEGVDVGMTSAEPQVGSRRLLCLHRWLSMRCCRTAGSTSSLATPRASYGSYIVQVVQRSMSVRFWTRTETRSIGRQRVGISSFFGLFMRLVGEVGFFF